MIQPDPPSVARARRYVHSALAIARKHKDDSQAMADIYTLLEELELAE